MADKSNTSPATKPEAPKAAAPAAAPAPSAAAPAKANGVTKIEAVRRALDKLGVGAKPGAILEYVKKTFGVDMTRDHAKTCKGKILRERKGKAKPAPKPTAPAAAVTKAAAPKPKPKAKPKKKTKAKPAPKKPAPKAAAPRPAAAVRSNGTTIHLPDIEAVKGLLGRVGAAQLKGLVDLLAK
jgi:hypothetical protein